MSLEDNLTAAVVRPVIVGLLDFATEPLRGWTGPGSFLPTSTGDSDLDNETFLEAESAISISEVSQDQGLGGPITITFSGGSLDGEDVVQQLIGDRRAFLGRKAKLWLFFLSADESSVLADFTVLFNGVMVSAKTVRNPGSPALITVTCDQDLQQAHAAPVRWIDHQMFYTTDTFSTFINDLSRGAIASGNPVQGRVNPSVTVFPNQAETDRLREQGYTDADFAEFGPGGFFNPSGSHF